MRDEDVSVIAKALSHPDKVSIIRDMRTEGKLSPVAWSVANGVPLGNASYHFGSLLKLGVLKAAGTRQRRGALEHFYTLKGSEAEAVLRALDAIDGMSDS